ncbi:hypothetical protein RSOLAG22IIIB_02643 [Rhizoctonia solani]|uniref:DRBM domain-containing protein n=1 Tax=Rhizoctonia solani TaxID=456999 RepID=A0A0K6GGJ5_9AGAM|nr:hypothetical protein RSOLAG22IIIB_02643 [Rhizoctonia solani]
MSGQSSNQSLQKSSTSDPHSEESENILKLHNWLQSEGRSPKLEWDETHEGPLHNCIWISTLKVNGVPKGIGRGKRKQVSRNLAAGQALQWYLETEKELEAND